MDNSLYTYIASVNFQLFCTGLCEKQKTFFYFSQNKNNKDACHRPS